MITKYLRFCVSPKSVFFRETFLKLQITDIQLITLPPLKSDLAKATFKDPYNFGFVDMTKVKQETDLEDQLTTKVTDFLLELGTGFAFVRRQFPLNIDGDESRYINF